MAVMGVTTIKRNSRAVLLSMQLLQHRLLDMPGAVVVVCWSSAVRAQSSCNNGADV